MASIDVVFIHFRTLGLEHLDAAWFTLARQDFTDVARVIMLDNNTTHAPRDIEAVLDRYPLPPHVQRILCFQKHGQLDRTQSWSVNFGVDLATNEWVFLSRADFLLDDTCLQKFRAVRDSHPPDWRGFVTSWCHQMGYDASLSNTDALAPHSLPGASWRTEGLASLVGQVPAVHFHNTHVDAGVWLMRRSLLREVGGLNERMVAWGYQQQAFQRALLRAGVEIQQVQEYLFHHQHHYAPRDFALAGKEAQFEQR